MKTPLAAVLTAFTLAAAPASVLAQTHEHAGHAMPAPAPKAAPKPKPAAARVEKGGTRVVALTVTDQGFEPANVKVAAGYPVRLVVTRKTEKTCATELVLADLGISEPLPLHTPVTVEFTPGESGTLRYACGMDHVSGVITVG